MIRSVLAGTIASLVAAVAAVPALADTDIKFALDWKFEGPTAPYFVAIDKGYYKAEGLNVSIDTGAGSVSGIPRVAVGTHQLGFFDLNSVVRFRDQNPEKDIKVVMMLYDRPPFAIGTLKKAGITKPKDLEGRILGAPAADGAFAQWKAFVQANGIDESKVKIENVGFPVREPMLADGKVDAITGFTFSMHFNLLQKGIPADQIQMLVMSDYGLSLYGNGIIVNPDFLKNNPEAVKGFIRATIKGLQDTVKDPATAVKAVMKRYETGDEKTERERLELVLREHVVTPWVKQNGVGDVDPARLAKSVDQIGVTYEYKNKPFAIDVFTNKYLPPAADRKL
ncbi:ABC transporter substrate-binding protein [Rhodoplanes elegans]|uniref:ABC transporter substrate-binding protein n=1 Tax=Rhodoplanes elegans TaxID=29408 RepID=A0A327KFN3_9BRAD|nr:ABC transporter substrate-binding protein [Rhodoplanes elegans]MBK5958726.1 ABC transporter substrate-binding protein [Rhodoplanes elegans]RAI36964.1 ABC transporter substrate-binding protein [Rhodoplanes elegans]